MFFSIHPPLWVWGTQPQAPLFPLLPFLKKVPSFPVMTLGHDSGGPPGPARRDSRGDEEEERGGIEKSPDQKDHAILAKQKIRKWLLPVQITLLCLFKGVPLRRNKLLFVFWSFLLFHQRLLEQCFVDSAICALCPVINPGLSVQLTRRSLQKISGGRRVFRPGKPQTPFFPQEPLGTSGKPHLTRRPGKPQTPFFSGLKVTNPFCTKARRRLGPQGFHRSY